VEQLSEQLQNEVPSLETMNLELREAPDLGFRFTEFTEDESIRFFFDVSLRLAPDYINLDIKVKEEPQVALIEEVKFSQKKVKPGDKLELKVKLRPYRQEAIINKYEFKLPEDIETGIASLELIGGREANFTLQQEVEREETEYGHGENETFKDLEEVLKAFKEQKINSDLVLRILPNYQMEAVPVSKTGEDNSDMNSPHENAQMPVDDAQMISNEYEESFATDYILEGRVDTEIEIISNETPNEESGKQQKEVDKPQKFDKKSKNQ
jgi:hypothetical protein